MSKETETQAMFGRIALICMAFVCVISLLAIASWILNQPILASIHYGDIPIAPIMAVIFLGLCSTWLIYRVFPARRGVRILVQAFLVGMLIIILILAFRSFTGRGPDLELLFLLRPPLFGHISSAPISPQDTLGFFLAIAAFLLLTSGKPGQGTKSASATLSLALFILSSINILGHLFEAPLLYGGTIVPVAITTAISFWFLCVGLLMTAGPSCWPVRVFTGSSLKARLMRAFIPASIVIVIIQGFLGTALDTWRISSALQVAGATLVALSIVIPIISLLAKNVSAEIERGMQAEEKLVQVEDEIRKNNEDLTLLNDINAAVNRGESLADIMGLISEKVKSIFSSLGVTLHLFNADRSRLVMQNMDLPTRTTAQIEKLLGMTIPVIEHDLEQAHPFRHVLESRRAQLVVDPNQIQEFFAGYIEAVPLSVKARLRIKKLMPDIVKLLGFQSEMIVPLISGTELIGTLDVGSREQFTEGDLRRLEVIAGQLTAAIKRKQAEQELFKLSMAVDDSSDAIFMTNLEGVITFVNTGFTKLYGYSAIEIVGKTTPRILKSGETKAEDYEVFWQTLLNKQMINGEIINKTKDGRLLNIERSANPILNQQGEIIGFLSIQRDITQRKRFELVQDAIFRITQAAITSEGIDALYHSIHSILGELIPAENFYISLYDAVKGLISFPYYVDQFDEPPPGPTPIQGLTGYVIRTGRPLLAPTEIFDRLVQQGEVEVVGATGVDWMGAPLKVEGRIIGVMAVQSYTEGINFNQKDLSLLEFVSSQVAQTIERKRLEEEIVSLSLTDELTGLYNRRGFTMLAEQEMKLARRFKRSVLLYFCDVDNLKSINDSLGHSEGDLAVKEMGAILKETFREADIPARFGGDEFVVLAPDASMEIGELIKKRLQATQERRNREGARPYQLTFSMGIAHFDPEAPCTISELITQADEQMYQQKKERKRN